MTTAELRKKYLAFFESRGHKLFASDTLFQEDESALFTSAGMSQFKPYFLGQKKDVRRATSCQKCLRTGDLERVGTTPYHHTFFEMLGNFSFGDYFKKEAIVFAWEFLTKELNLKPDDLWVSVYHEDDEAFGVWKNSVGVPEGKIVRLGEETNFWPANAPLNGPNGPCGPCSEIFFDRGAATGCGKPGCNPDCSCGRFVEIWNLVFTQYNRVDVHTLEPLPQKNIDTGMGLERMSAVMQGKYSNFDIDEFRPAVDFVFELLKRAAQPDIRPLVNAIVDHARAAVFAIADDIYPSNEARGYVIRKIIRKASFAGHQLGLKKAFLYKLAPIYRTIMGDFYPEIVKKAQTIETVIGNEEERFLSTLESGQAQLESMIARSKSQGRSVLAAEDLFLLYDTYGFPTDLSKDIARTHGIQVDEAGFVPLLQRQKERSRQQSMFDEGIFNQKDFHLDEKTQFVGYQSLESKSTIVRLFVGTEEAENIGEGLEGAVLLDATPFYAESGGQLSDTGTIVTEQGTFRVEKVFKVAGAVLHKGRVVGGMLSKTSAHAVIDPKRRKAMARAHSGTHLLQAALRKILGDHVVQQGSLVDEDRFRFDFTHFQALTNEQLAQAVEMVNDFIVRSDNVSQETLSFDQAKAKGALAFFKDKYGSSVRVISVDDYSKELCGGTHVTNTAEIGMLVVESESSIASGIRRIEALTGKKAYAYIQEALARQAKIAELTKVPVAQTAHAVAELIAQIKGKDAEIAVEKKQRIALKASNLKPATINGIVCIVHKEDLESQYLLTLSDALRQNLVGLFLSVMFSDKNFVITASPESVKQGITAKKLFERIKGPLHLRGGGKDNLVQGVIEQPEAHFKDVVEKSISELAKQ